MKHFNFRKIWFLQTFLFYFCFSTSSDDDDDKVCSRQIKLDQNSKKKKKGPVMMKWLETQSNGHAGIAPF